MRHDEPALFPWLMDDRYLSKALVTYNIKLLDARLHQLMAPVWRDGTGLQHLSRFALRQLLDCCTDLIKRYECFLEEPDCSSQLEPRDPHVNFEPNLSTCYLTIQQFKQRLRDVRTADDEACVTGGLLFYYRNLRTLLLESSRKDSKTELVPAHTSSEPGRSAAINGLLAAKNWRDWLMAMVVFAQEQGENTACYRMLIERLAEQELLELYYLFDQPDYISLINSLFLYKTNPQSLYEHILHPEKLVSVQTRLTLLHSFIELLHASVRQTLRQRGFNADHDYLLHGNDMPTGVSVDNAGSFRDGIAMAVKEWGLARLINPDDGIRPGKLDELFQAYKFWFNPCRLIDAVMKLQTQLTGDCQSGANIIRLFSSQMSLMYRRLTTDQCLDLYGYFSNKSSCYLMRSLLAVLDGPANSFLPVSDEQDKQAIRQVYLALDCVMNALRDELQHRHISTEAYARQNYLDVKPGRRIVHALTRIVQVYGVNREKKNDRLDQLFRELEKSIRG